MSDWLNFETTTAPNPDKKKDPLTIAISPLMVEGTLAQNRRTPIYQAWTHVLGKLPPINNIGKVASAKPPPTVTTLHDAVACFGGLQRPHDDEKDGASVLVYVLAPTISVEYSPSMVCLARTVKVPSNTVLTVQVRPYFPLQGVPEGINGLVTRIEPVFAEPGDSRLPARFETRYGQRFW
ncbi:MAG: hypothetical protein E5V90_07370 [Mesorhizobium sp.]|nr:MAG: hypothetical protein E5V90_07370 [Mesorhizobium sp.]